MRLRPSNCSFFTWKSADRKLFSLTWPLPGTGKDWMTIMPSKPHPVLQWDYARCSAIWWCYISFPMRRAQQGCVLTPILFGIFLSAFLSFAFPTDTEGVYLDSRRDRKLFNLARLKVKIKVQTALIRDLLYADDATLITPMEEGLQGLMGRISHACNKYWLTIRFDKTAIGLGYSIPTWNYPK